jgi:glycosidase
LAHPTHATFEFHVARAARDHYQFDESLFTLTGNVVFANFHACRVFAKKINDKRDVVRFPERTVRAGQINAMGLIDEILHYVCGLYREQRNASVWDHALRFLTDKCGGVAVDTTLERFVDMFPNVAVYKGDLSPADYLNRSTAGIPHRQLVLEEMLMLWLANVNPAFSPYGELFDNSTLVKETAFRDMISGLEEFFANQPFFGPENQNLIAMLRSPAIAVPHSLQGQLTYILERWGPLLGRYLYRLLSGLDLMKEEEKGAIWAGGGGPGRASVYHYGGQELDLEKFSPDKDWMPKLVLLAKNAYVWLDQLSRQFKRDIRNLSDVPDEELDTLAHRGFTGLWLIGLWERSKASQRIKQLCGNADAVASAYSLHDYHIAHDLGGDEAYRDLRDRAWKRGIRLASDMVPNHMGIDSRWVVEHPDWFIGLDHSPFPSYSFNGPNLSQDGRVGIYLEDHYFSRSDAAVVFKRVDHGSGHTRYIYHGNDGTSMPWNDTAQLDFLNPKVREAVIGTILEVARKFSVIRFDAAMTLARKHYQRLWFPEPGTGGAIPSRSDYGLTRDQLHAAMPQEFWREVVDTVAREVPDTLLLAEAFWMMEGYFVRTLGMHRVYNSAFMNMLKNEDNANYRSVMKNTLEFNPEILKRFVNFMNNPDEDTAVAQFGKDGKYFGVAIIMSTMPGLPMFGHGQVEGFTEKYGMEYRRAYWDEKPEQWLVDRHEREIFPLLRKRYLFAEVANFYLYDVFAPEGHVVEDVFAYSNRSGDERSLVVYHNKWATCRGWIRTSVGYNGKTGRGEERTFMRKCLGDALALNPAGDHFCIFRDHITGLEYIRNNQELWDKGLFIELTAYKYHVFLDFRQVRDNEWHQYAHLAAYLDGRGVPNMEEALKEVFLQEIHSPFKELVNPGMYRRLFEAREGDLLGAARVALLDEAEWKLTNMFTAMKSFSGGKGDATDLAREVRQQLEAALYLPRDSDPASWPQTPEFQAIADELQAVITDDVRIWGTLFSWVFVHSLGRIVSDDDAAATTRSWIDEWLLGRLIARVLHDLGLEEHKAEKAVQLVRLLTTHQSWFGANVARELPAYHVVEALLKDADGQQFLHVNRFQDVLWFTGEQFDELLDYLFLAAVIQFNSRSTPTSEQASDEIVKLHAIVRKLRRAGRRAEHQVEMLLEEVAEGRVAPAKEKPAATPAKPTE